MPSIKQIINKLTTKKRSVYRGSFDSYQEAFNNAKSSQTYGDQQYDKRSLLSINFDEPFTQGRNILIPFLLSLLYSSKKTTILDFGGGVNSIFSHLSTEQRKHISCFIIEREELVDDLNQLINEKEIQNLYYKKSIDGIGTIDIAYFGSSIQYVKNYEELLDQISSLKPEFIVFSESIFTKRNFDFYVIQINMKNNEFPNCFISEEKINSIMDNKGYKCIFSKAIDNKGHKHETINQSEYDCKTLIFRLTT